MPERLRDRLNEGESLFLLDVREPWEVDVCRLEGSVNIPMQQVPARLAEIPRDRPIVCVCHHGMRSEQVARFLTLQGLERVENLVGGIEEWANRVDPETPRY